MRGKGLSPLQKFPLSPAAGHSREILRQKGKSLSLLLGLFFRSLCGYAPFPERTERRVARQEPALARRKTFL